jgi:hypothetical protein
VDECSRGRKKKKALNIGATEVGLHIASGQRVNEDPAVIPDPGFHLGIAEGVDEYAVGIWEQVTKGGEVVTIGVILEN